MSARDADMPPARRKMRVPRYGVYDDFTARLMRAFDPRLRCRHPRCLSRSIAIRYYDTPRHADA